MASIRVAACGAARPVVTRIRMPGFSSADRQAFLSQVTATSAARGHFERLTAQAETLGKLGEEIGGLLCVTISCNLGNDGM